MTSEQPTLPTAHSASAVEQRAVVDKNGNVPGARGPESPRRKLSQGVKWTEAEPHDDVRALSWDFRWAVFVVPVMGTVLTYAYLLLSHASPCEGAPWRRNRYSSVVLESLFSSLLSTLVHLGALEIFAGWDRRGYVLGWTGSLNSQSSDTGKDIEVAQRGNHKGPNSLVKCSLFYKLHFLLTLAVVLGSFYLGLPSGVSLVLCMVVTAITVEIQRHLRSSCQDEKVLCRWFQLGSVLYRVTMVLCSNMPIVASWLAQVFGQDLGEATSIAIANFVVEAVCLYFFTAIPSLLHVFYTLCYSAAQSRNKRNQSNEQGTVGALTGGNRQSCIGGVFVPDMAQQQNGGTCKIVFTIGDADADEEEGMSEQFLSQNPRHSEPQNLASVAHRLSVTLQRPQIQTSEETTPRQEEQLPGTSHRVSVKTDDSCCCGDVAQVVTSEDRTAALAYARFIEKRFLGSFCDAECTIEALAKLNVQKLEKDAQPLLDAHHPRYYQSIPNYNQERNLFASNFLFDALHLIGFRAFLLMARSPIMYAFGIVRELIFSSYSFGVKFEDAFDSCHGEVFHPSKDRMALGNLTKICLTGLMDHIVFPTGAWGRAGRTVRRQVDIDRVSKAVVEDHTHQKAQYLQACEILTAAGVGNGVEVEQTGNESRQSQARLSMRESQRVQSSQKDVLLRRTRPTVAKIGTAALSMILSSPVGDDEELPRSSKSRLSMNRFSRKSVGVASDSEGKHETTGSKSHRRTSLSVWMKRRVEYDPPIKHTLKFANEAIDFENIPRMFSEHRDGFALKLSESNNVSPADHSRWATKVIVETQFHIVKRFWCRSMAKISASLAMLLIPLLLIPSNFSYPPGLGLQTGVPGVHPTTFFSNVFIRELNLQTSLPTEVDPQLVADISSEMSSALQGTSDKEVGMSSELVKAVGFKQQDTTTGSPLGSSHVLIYSAIMLVLDLLELAFLSFLHGRTLLRSQIYKDLGCIFDMPMVLLAQAAVSYALLAVFRSLYVSSASVCGAAVGTVDVQYSYFGI
eukprot:GHVQ01024385.1.p1 GENE.GHVQ01024385.1~~GHVQ01024385.1.p1  ORF type:complete len:1021 (+),score=123.69 GHVQ01024385.1:451-3513(+)